MNEKEIRELVETFDFDPNDFDKIVFVAKEVSRRTRHRFFRTIQAANNAADAGEISHVDIEHAAYENMKHAKD